MISGSIISSDEGSSHEKFKNSILESGWKCEKVKSTQVRFPVSKRGAGSGAFVRCFRFGSVEPGWINSNKKCAIIFYTNRNILLHGVYLFGSEGNNYSVNLTIIPYGCSITVASTKGTFSSVQHKSKKFWGFDVFLKPAVSLLKGVRYNIDGGMHGNIHVESSGVTFNLKNSVNCFDGTGVKHGQLPGFIFSLWE